MIKAIVIPTPKRLKKYIRDTDFKKKAKSFVTPARAIIYEILEKWYDEYGNDEELREMMMQNRDYWNNFYMRF